MRQAQESLERYLQASVRADRDYRVAKSQAYLKSDGKTVSDKDAAVELLVDEDRLKAKMSEAMAEAAKSRLQNLRSEMNALTAIMYTARTEMELAHG